MKYTIKNVEGHIAVELNEGLFIVDTGSPSSFTPGGRITFGGEEFNTGTSAMGVIDADKLSGYLKTHVDGLIGQDILARFTLTFCKGCFYTGDDDSVLDEDGNSFSKQSFIPLESRSFMTVPVVTVNMNGKSVEMFLDTGATISYSQKGALANFPVEETRKDFFPMIGEFDVDISTVACDINGDVFEVKFGRLPPLLEMTLTMGGVKGILGSDIFKVYTVRIEKGGGRVSVAKIP